MIVKLLTEHLLECLSLKRDCTGSSESTLDNMPHCWKSHLTAHLIVHGSDNLSMLTKLNQPQGNKIDF